MDDYIIKRFENPDEIREFDKGKYEVVNLPHMTIGKATYYIPNPSDKSTYRLLQSIQ